MACGYGLAGLWVWFGFRQPQKQPRRRHSRHAKPCKSNFGASKTPFRITRGVWSGPPIALLPTAHASCLHPQAPQSACQTPQAPQSACQTILGPKVILERRKHLFRSFGECELHSGPPKYCLLSFLLLTLLACARRRHRRHAKPYPKVFLASKTPFRIIRGHFLATEVLLAQNDTQNDTETTPLELQRSHGAGGWPIRCSCSKRACGLRGGAVAQVKGAAWCCCASSCL